MWKGKKENVLEEKETDKYYDLSISNKNWRRITGILLLINIFLICCYTVATRSNKIQTFVVERTNNNEFKILGDVNNLPKRKINDDTIIYFAYEVISNIKSLPKEKEIYKKNYKKSLYFLTTNSSKKFSQYLKEEKYVEKKRKGEVVETVFNTALKLADNTYQIRWTQYIYNETGNLIERKNYLGIVVVEIGEIQNKQQLINNPLGLFIKDFSQREERITE